MFIRNSDGTGWEGHISYKWSAIRENHLRLIPMGASMPSIEEVYQSYGVCPVLEVPKQLFNTDNLDCIYRFLYGYSVEELMEERESDKTRYKKYIHEPQEWTLQMVMSMDWKMFCLAYYAFLGANSDFESKTWNVLEYIFVTLKKTPAILTSLLEINNMDSDSESCLVFWETIYDGLQTKIFESLKEDTCYRAFLSMLNVRHIFSDERYEFLKNKCCKFFDEVAKKRIDNAQNKKYSVRELTNFNIELLFFYEDYFNSSDNNEKLKQYVINSVFNLLLAKADKVAIAENFLGADKIYETALQYAQSDSDRTLVQNKRNKITYSVSVAKLAQEETMREYEKKREEELEEIRRRNKTSDIVGNILLALFLSSIVFAILFGILALFGVFKPFAKIVFVVSLSILVLFLIMLSKFK